MYQLIYKSLNIYVMEMKFLNRVIFNPAFQGFIPSLDVLHFIACQFALESDFGLSMEAQKYSNYCGMKYPFRRFTYAVDRDGDFAVYSCFTDCCRDYLSWIFYNRPYQNVLQKLDSFKIFLRNSGYCPEKGYIQHIESIYDQYFQTSKN